MIDDKNPHTVYHPGFMISDWKDHTAAGVNDKWNKAEFHTWGRHGMIAFSVTESVQYDKMMSLLTQVYQSGVFSAKSEIRKVLGVKD